MMYPAGSLRFLAFSVRGYSDGLPEDPMNMTLHGKTLEVRLTSAAEKAMALRERPLVAEMALLFS
jgi:hypothetical protein